MINCGGGLSIEYHKEGQPYLVNCIPGKKIKKTPAPGRDKCFLHPTRFSSFDVK
jgi:hypothetical protein